LFSRCNDAPARGVSVHVMIILHCSVPPAVFWTSAYFEQPWAKMFLRSSLPMHVTHTSFFLQQQHTHGQNRRLGLCFSFRPTTTTSIPTIKYIKNRILARRFYETHRTHEKVRYASEPKHFSHNSVRSANSFNKKWHASTLTNPEIVRSSILITMSRQQSMFCLLYSHRKRTWSTD
jgi:hypothetical protein